MSGLLQKIKTLFEKLKVFGSSYANDSIKIERDWKIFLTLTFTSLLVSAIFGFYLYKQINEGKIFTSKTDTTKQEVKIDAVLLKKVVSEINLRETNISEIKQNKSIPSDPSL